MITPKAELARLKNDVTRFLLHPGCQVSHPTLEGDLQVVAVASRDGDMRCTVVPHGEEPDPKAKPLTFPLSELWPGGPIPDIVRDIGRALVKAQIDTTISAMQREGLLQTPDMTDSGKVARSKRPEGATADCQACGTTGICGDCNGLGWIAVPMPEVAAVIHELQVHGEYIIDPNGVSARPADDV